MGQVEVELRQFTGGRSPKNICRAKSREEHLFVRGEDQRRIGYSLRSCAALRRSGVIRTRKSLFRQKSTSASQHYQDIPGDYTYAQVDYHVRYCAERGLIIKTGRSFKELGCRLFDAEGLGLPSRRGDLTIFSIWEEAEAV